MHDAPPPRSGAVMILVVAGALLSTLVALWMWFAGFGFLAIIGGYYLSFLVFVGFWLLSAALLRRRARSTLRRAISSARTHRAW